MARLRYYPTPADLAGAFGESVPLLGADGVTPLPGNPTGRLFAAHEASVSFQVCTTDDIADVTTDLLADGVEVDTWDTSEDFVTLGRGPILEGPDNHVGPLYLTADAGTTFYRIEPDSTEVYARLAAVELDLETKELSDLPDVDTTGRADLDVLKWSTSLGKHVYDAAGAGSVTSVAEVAPVSGDVDATDLRAALGLATAITALGHAVQCIDQVGPGYATPAETAVFVIYKGAATPPVLATSFLWIRLPSGA